VKCKEHYQGDRCVKATGHQFSVAAAPDPVHVGANQAWSGEGDSKTLVAKFVAKAPRRSRAANRALRNFDVKNDNRELSKVVITHLINHYRGIK
jgi:hypothetical protein